jgi:hypothetical protein
MKKQMMVALFLAFVALLLARRPAHADSVQDFLASVKMQTSAVKVETEKALVKAKTDAEQAKKIAVETQASCSELVTAAAELAKAQAEAKVQTKVLEAAQSDATKIVDAARVRSLASRRVVRPILRDEGPASDLEVNEAPWVTRMRVVEACKTILAKQAPAAASAPATAP